MNAVSATIPTGKSYRSAFGAYKTYWLIIALFIAIVMTGVNFGGFKWFNEHFTGPLSLGVAGVLVVLCSYIWIFGARPLAQALHANSNGLAIFAHSTDLRIEYEKRVDSIIELFSTFIGAEPSATSLACQTLNECVKTSVAAGSKPYVDEMILEEYEAEFDVLLKRLESSRNFLASLALIGTILGLVTSFTSQGQAPTTPEETKLWGFLIIHGMGIAYLSSLLGWVGVGILYVFDNSAQRQADTQCSFFRNRLVAFLTPVVESEMFYARMKKLEPHQTLERSTS